MKDNVSLSLFYVVVYLNSIPIVFIVHFLIDVKKKKNIHLANPET